MEEQTKQYGLYALNADGQPTTLIADGETIAPGRYLLGQLVDGSIHFETMIVPRQMTMQQIIEVPRTSVWQM